MIVALSLMHCSCTCECVIIFQPSHYNYIPNFAPLILKPLLLYNSCLATSLTLVVFCRQIFSKPCWLNVTISIETYKLQQTYACMVLHPLVNWCKNLYEFQIHLHYIHFGWGQWSENRSHTITAESDAFVQGQDWYWMNFFLGLSNHTISAFVIPCRCTISCIVKNGL